MKRIILLFFAILSFTRLSATHLRAGEITYTQISDLTYEITVTTYTYTLSPVDRTEYSIDFGDNSSSMAARISKTVLPNYYCKNVYTVTHTFPGPGVYKIYVEDPNRNEGVENIPNSVNVYFSVSTTLIVNSTMGYNNTPVLLNPPYDKAALGHIFIHNPGAYDSDGDSLSYKLTVCTREDDKSIVGYTLPPASNYIKVDSISGDLIWDAPTKTGKFNVAMEIQEWRNHVKIDAIVRDMQIEVYDSDNNPPVTSPLSDFCVEVGDTVNFPIKATDADNDSVSLKAASGIFSLTDCPASFITETSSKGSAKARLYWVPCYSAVRHQPYDIVVKSEDYNSDLQLVDMDNMSIKVLGPAPHLNSATP
jgi:hypothetical protein